MVSNVELEKEELRKILTNELPVMRAKLRMSQESLCKTIGISRQTYTANETGRRLMSWNTFVLLFLFFDSHEETKNALQTMGSFTDRAREFLKAPKAPYQNVSTQYEETKKDNDK